MAIDILVGGFGDDIHVVDDVGDMIREQGGTDTVQTVLNSYTLANPVPSTDFVYTPSPIPGGIGISFPIFYDNAIEKLEFVGDGNFSGTGNNLNNTIIGGAGNDTLDGGQGDMEQFDRLVGGKGDDVYRIRGSEVVVENANEGIDTIEYVSNPYGYNFVVAANIENAKFIGEGGVYILGNDLNNVITTGNGNDQLSGGAGRDTLVGGKGNDAYSIDEASDVVVEGSNGGMDEVYSHAAYYLLAAEVEDLWLTDGLEVTLSYQSATGNGLANKIWGGGANNAISGGAGDDTIDGSFGDDVIAGDADNDLLTGSMGNDTLDGGSGYDVADYLGGRHDYMISKNADGTVNVTDVWANDGDDGIDLISGIEALHFRDGLVTLDSLVPVTQSPNPQPPTPQPPVVAPTTSGSDMILGLDAAEKLYGGGGNDQVSGGAGNDWVYGGIGNDQVSGGIGNDRLYGDAGKDQLTGGAGKDYFVFNSKPNKTTNIDKIVDFNVRDDSIYLENAIFKALGKAGSSTKPALLKSSFFYSGTKAHDKDDHIIHNKKTGAIYYDVDGTGSSQLVQIATVNKGLTLTYKDFYVI
ncbi:calcium-binding protein [Microvirga aerilata]